MSKVKVKHYYPCNYPLLKTIQKNNEVRIPRTYFLDMAKELCEFHNESFDAFVDSTNGVRLLNDGIDDCYSNLWLSPVVLHKSARSVADRFTEVSKKIYDKIELWIARVKKCKVNELKSETEIYKKYITGNVDKKIYYFITCGLPDKNTTEHIYKFNDCDFVLFIDEDENTGMLKIEEVNNI
jgi:hypothetical protein